MSKKINTDTTPTVSITKVKEPKTIKVKTLMIAISFIAVALVSFLGGLYTQGKYNDTVHAQAVELSKHLK